MTDRKPLVGHFDAKKHAYRQTQDGVVISFVVDPADITPEFAAAPLGTTLKIGYAEYDPETGQAKEAPKAEKPKKRFEDMKPSQQAGILCADPEFWKYLDELSLHWRRGADTAEEAAAVKVRKLCNVESRSELNRSDKAAWSWAALLGAYRDWQRTDNRYAGTPALEGK